MPTLGTECPSGSVVAQSLQLHPSTQSPSFLPKGSGAIAGAKTFAVTVGGIIWL